MLIQLKPEYGKNYFRGQVYFTYTMDSPVSEGITWFCYKNSKDIKELDKVSHCGLCIGKDLGIAALGLKGRVVYENLNDYFNDPKTRIFFKEPKLLNNTNCELLIRISENYIDTPYDYALASGIAFVNSWALSMLTDNMKYRILKKFNSLDKLICSEAIMLWMFASGLSTDSNFLKTPRQVLEHEFLKKWKESPYE